MIRTLRSFFSKELKSVQHFQCSYTNHSAWKMTKGPFTLSPLGRLILISPNVFVFHLFHVLRAERSRLKSHSGHWFSNYLNSLNFSGVFLVLQINVPAKDQFYRLFLKLLSISKFWQNLVSTLRRLRKIWEIWRKNYCFSFNSMKISKKKSAPTSIKLWAAETYTICFCNWN